MPDKIYKQLVAIQTDLTAIAKDRKNEAQGFKYRGIDQVYNALNPLLSKHGVFMTAEIIGKERQERTNAKGTVLAFTSLRMRYRFYADDGSNVATEAEGEGMDSGDKSSNKAMAVAHKYAILQAFCVPTEDIPDPDAEVHEVAPRANGRGTPKTTEPPANPDQEWHDLAQKIRGDIDEATTANRIGDIMESRQLAELTAWKETTGKFLRDRALKRLATIVQQPPKKPAPPEPEEMPDIPETFRRTPPKGSSTSVGFDDSEIPFAAEWR